MFHMIRSTLLLATIAIVTIGAVGAVGPTPEMAWAEKLPASDRAYMERHVGFAPPAFPSDLDWVGAERIDWASLRGKVVILHTWTTRSRTGRQIVERIDRALEGYDPAQVAVILLHTPTGRDNVERFLEKKPVGHPVAIDRSGAYCDTIGFYKKPTNIVVDRQGNVRFVGVRTQALGDAIRPLVDASFDSTVAANLRAVAAPAAYPPFVGAVTNATDFRGKKAPSFHVERWLNDEPTLDGQVLILDFWATWCGPCVGSIPHMNSIAMTAGENVTVIGISDETASSFDKGLRGLEKKRNITMDTFRYPLALDPSGKMKNAISIRGIPHAIVISPDGIVRWQGHPAGLSPETVKQIAQAAGATSGSAAPPVRRRWTR